MARSDPATDAMCDLNAAYSIIAICESGIFRTVKGKAFATRMVKMCKDHAGKQLRDYDRARHD